MSKYSHCFLRIMGDTVLMHLFILSNWLFLKQCPTLPPHRILFIHSPLFLLMFLLGKVNPTLLNDLVSRLAYLGVVRSLNFLYFLAGSGEMLFTPFLQLEPVSCESRGSSSLIISLLSYSAISNCINCPSGWMCTTLGAPVAVAAGDILRCFWKHFSPYLRAVVLRCLLYYNHLEGLLNHSFLGAALGEGSSV